MKSMVIVRIKATGGWEWLLATIIGICLTELIAAESRSHNQNRLSLHFFTFLGSEGGVECCPSRASGSSNRIEKRQSIAIH
jgi:hypothetical protein